MKHIIIAPHADDEIIGCWKLLQNQQWNCRVLHDEPPTEAQRIAFLNYFPWVHLIEPTKYTNRGELIDIVKLFATSEDTHCYFPDPIYETHPLHKIWGNVGSFLFQSRLIPSVSFYTTNMTAPYLREEENAEEKREALDTIYPEKADLWRYDHKYWLFSGMISWY